MTEWDLAYMRRRVQPTDADIDRIADAVPVDQIGVHITTWHRRFARAVLAAQPAPVPCARNELVTAIHSLASNFENSMYAFRDDTEARRKATGDIAHAMKIAAKHNQNGPGCSAAPVPVPLTAIQILGGLMDAGVPDRFFHAFTAGARFAERKHGIAASPEVPLG